MPRLWWLTAVDVWEKQPPVPGLRGAVPEGGGSAEPQGLRDHGHLRWVPSSAVELRELRQRGGG